MKRLSIQWVCAVVGMVVCAGAARGQLTGLNVPPSMPAGEVGVSYSGPSFVAIEGGAESCCTWTVSGGPAGLTITSGSTTASLVGTPMASGNFTLTVTANDGLTPLMANTTLTVNPAPSVSTTSLLAGEVMVPYSQTLTPTGGSGGYTFSLASGSLPAGLSLSSGGAITGTPTAATPTPASFTVTVTDSVGGSGSQALTINIIAAPSITTTSLLPGEVTVAYSQSLSAAGGSGTLTWSLLSGSLPAGLSLSAAGAITGTPTAATPTPASFTVKVTDGAGAFATQALTLNIAAAPSITTTSLPPGEVTVSYSQTLVATGGAGTLTWSISSGSLPTGLTLSAAGAITGTPSAATPTPASFTVKVTDTAGGAATQALTLNVIAGPSITTGATLQAGEVGASYSPVTLAASGGTGTGFTWAVSTGSLPAGLSLNATTGVISGTPSASGPSSFTVKVTDSAGGFGTQAFTLNVIGGPTITTGATLPQGEAGALYSPVTLKATGGAGSPYTWSLATDSLLPAGLALSAGGVISGTPTASGPFSFTIQVTDSAGGSGTRTFSVTIITGPTITNPPTLQSGTQNVAYMSVTLTATGGTPPYTWSVSAGSLDGLTLDGNAGTISGTPTATGTFNPTIQVQDAKGVTGTKVFSITIASGLTIVTAPTLPNGSIGTPYGVTLTAQGGTSPYTWVVTAGALPTGLTLGSTGGVISGNPTSSGTFPFTVQVTDTNQVTANKSFTITIAASLTISNAPTLPSGVVGGPYSQTLSATGGTPPYSWVISAGALPGGLNLSSGGSISGTPTTGGPFSFTVQVTDSTTLTATKSFSLSIAAQLAITTQPTLPSGGVGTSYSQTLNVVGGTAPYTWSVTAGSLPGGLSLNASAGTISGTPTSVGNFSFTVQVRDNTPVTTTEAFTLSIVSALTITSAPTLPVGAVGVNYAQSVVVVGGTAPYTWSISSGGLPAGLTLAPASGAISGTPTSAGSFTFTVHVTDSTSLTQTKAFTIVVVAGLTVTTAPVLPSGSVGVNYTATLAAAGGQTPYTWAVTAGGLPAGMVLDAKSGAVFGTPTASGTFSFTAKVTDNASNTATKQFSITIGAGLTITTAPVLPNGAIGAAYSAALNAVGGAPPYAWSITQGALPQGLTIDPVSGLITGSPATSAEFSFTVQVKDSSSATATKTFDLAISASLTISTPATLPIGSVGVPYSLSLVATGGTGSYQWKITSGALPPGLALASGTGAISGTPNGSGTFVFTVNVTDADAHAASQQFSLTVASGLAISTPAQLPSGSVGSAYSQTLSAVGGTPPYRWALASGAPTWLGINAATGVISGTPTANGTFRFSVGVTDNTGASTSLIFTLTIGSGLAITNPATLSGTLGQAYSLALAETGGVQPYTWAITQGSLPAGLSLSGATISGTPSAAGTFSFTLQVTDSSGSTATQAFTISINPPALPQVNISGVPESSTAAQQITFNVTLASAYALDITGTATLSFAPDAVAPAVDPAIQFSTGGTSVSLTIPKNSTNAVFGSSKTTQIALQTGTVSGTITLNITFEAGNAQLTALARTITIPRSAPTITAVTVVTSSNSFQVEVTGFSTPRELTEADLTFTPASGADLQTTSAIIDLTAVGKQWFQSATSAQFGSQYILILPFTASQGSISAVASVSVTLKDSQGASAATSANF